MKEHIDYLSTLFVWNDIVSHVYVFLHLISMNSSTVLYYTHFYLPLLTHHIIVQFWIISTINVHPTDESKSVASRF